VTFGDIALEALNVSLRARGDWRHLRGDGPVCTFNLVGRLDKVRVIIITPPGPCLGIAGDDAEAPRRGGMSQRRSFHGGCRDSAEGHVFGD